MDAVDALDAPITKKIGGKEYTFPLWKTRELIPVLSRLKAVRMESCRRHLVAEKVADQARAFALYQEDTKALDPWDAHIHFISIDGVDECLVESLVRSGVPRSEAQDIVDRVGRFEDKKLLAIRVANIYEPAPPPAPTKQDTKGMALGDGTAPDQPKGFGDDGASAPKPDPATHPTEPAKAG